MEKKISAADLEAAEAASRRITETAATKSALLVRITGETHALLKAAMKETEELIDSVEVESISTDELVALNEYLDQLIALEQRAAIITARVLAYHFRHHPIDTTLGARVGKLEVDVAKFLESEIPK